VDANENFPHDLFKISRVQSELDTKPMYENEGEGVYIYTLKLLPD
jgi:hypothetical protein